MTKTDFAIKKLLPGVKENILLKNYTTFKIGGPARYFFAAKNKTDLILAIKAAKKLKLPFFVLGKGSNVLAADAGFPGLVIKIENAKCKMKIEKAGCKIICEAGMPLSQLILKTIKNGFFGLEWAIGVPGTVGGAVLGNAGAFGNSMKNIVKKVEVFDAKREKIKIFKNKECKFDYRSSIFKTNPDLIILSCEMEPKKRSKNENEERISFFEIRKYLKRRKESQPLNLPSAGSIFKNPRNFSAGRLIERCGLKGKKIGRAKISEKHANFIVNLGGARAEDVKKLIKLVKQRVKKKFGIILEEEIRYF